MAQRFAASFEPVPALGCTTIFGIAAPVTLTTDANGVVTAARIDTAPLASILAGKIRPAKTKVAAATATAAATSVSSAQATHVFGHGTGQMRHKGWSNSGFKFNQGISRDTALEGIIDGIWNWRRGVRSGDEVIAIKAL